MRNGSAATPCAAPIAKPVGDSVGNRRPSADVAAYSAAGPPAGVLVRKYRSVTDPSSLAMTPGCTALPVIMLPAPTRMPGSIVHDRRSGEVALTIRSAARTVDPVGDTTGGLPELKYIRHPPVF